ncbi:glutathione S-transferase [Paraburkholderia diazotrophica]|uniref:Glutathione S-transferase n=1 Tax=Paraburkholderia diazotrophica TaxID=667676 RepID=A0A1H6RMZ1_9BURK|nr:glutathione S-transferase [Paraburkholderia diazotrophica]
MKLYYWPKTRAFRALWMLEEIGAPYELVRVNLRAGEQDTTDFHHINPMCKLPALDDDGVQVAESGAVLLYLADRFPESKLGAPIDDPLRGRLLQWLFFTPGCLEPAMAEKLTGASGNSFSFGWGNLERVKLAIDTALDEGEWLPASALRPPICCWPARCRSRSSRSWSKRRGGSANTSSGLWRATRTRGRWPSSSGKSTR